MSYTTPTDGFLPIFSSTPGGGLNVDLVGVYAATPTIYDIATIQKMYGADPATRAGNSVYSWGQENPIFEVIFDAGGTDTIELTSHTRPSFLDLRPGAYSSVAYLAKTAQVEATVAKFGEGFRNFITRVINDPWTYTYDNNVGVAYGTTIENANLGSRRR